MYLIELIFREQPNHFRFIRIFISKKKRFEGSGTHTRLQKAGQARAKDFVRALQRAPFRGLQTVYERFGTC